MNKKTVKTSIYIILSIVGLLLTMYYLKSSGILEHMSSLESFKEYIKGFGDKAYIVFFLLQLLSIIIAPIPSNVSAAAGAMIFGMWQSFIITMLAIISGSMIVFFLSRKFGRKFTDKFVSKDISEKYENLIDSPKGEMILSLMLVLPFFPDDIINFLIGLSDMSFKRYMTILTITRPWEILAVSAVASANINIPLFVWVFIIGTIILLVKYSSKIEDKLIGMIKTI